MDEGGLGAILEPNAGLFDVLDSDIDQGISYLYVEIWASNLNHGQKNSLSKKLVKAAEAKWAGDEAYLNGDEAGALKLWSKAAKEMGKFASQVRNNGKAKGKGKKYDKPPQEWADIADGLAEAILQLPGTTEFEYTSDEGGGEATQAASEGDDGEGDGIPPGGYIDIPLGDLPVGSAAVLHGEVTSGEEVILEWADQVTIPGDLEPPVLLIEPEPIDGMIVNPEVVTLDSDDPDAVFGHWGLLPDDLYEPFTLVSGALPMDLTFDGEGYYEIMCFVEDTSGNLSAEEMVTVIIDDGEEEEWDIAQEVGAGWAWLGTRPLTVGSEELVNIGQGQSFTLGAPGVVMSVEVPIRLTGNQNGGIPSLVTGDLLHAAIYGPVAGIPLQTATTALTFDVGEPWVTFTFDERVPLYAGQEYILGIYTDAPRQGSIGFCPGGTDPDPYPYGMRYASIERVGSPMVWQSGYGDTDLLFRIDLEYAGLVDGP